MSFKGTVILCAICALGASSFGQNDGRHHGGQDTSPSRSSDNRGAPRSDNRSAPSSRGSWPGSGSRSAAPSYSGRSVSSSSFGWARGSQRSPSTFGGSPQSSRDPWSSSRSGSSSSNWTRSAPRGTYGGSPQSNSSSRSGTWGNPSQGSSYGNFGFGRSSQRSSSQYGASGSYQGRGAYGSRSNYSDRTNNFQHGGSRSDFGGGHHGGSLEVRNHSVYQRPEWGGNWREGYERRSGFGLSLNFGFYLNDPYSAPCYVSPWYYYSSLPPYIPASRVVVVPSYYCNWDQGTVYEYGSSDGYYSNHAGGLDEAINEIQDAYRDRNTEAIRALVPSYGSVAISTDGHYQYSISGNEFGDMFSDSVRGTDTVSFQIDEVRRSGSTAIVRATHEVRLSDGGQETIYQSYRLRNQGGRYVVTDFMTEHSPNF